MDDRNTCESFEALFHSFVRKALVVIDNSERCRDENILLRAALKWAFVRTPGTCYRIDAENEYDDDGGQIGETTYCWHRIGWEQGPPVVFGERDACYRVSEYKKDGYPDETSAILGAFLDHKARS